MFETPDDFYRYFKEHMKSDYPSLDKRTNGFRAAQLWKQYHDEKHETPELLHEIIKTLMPDRYSGSGFFALWILVVGIFRKLPLEMQIDLWKEVFDTKNHGDNPISGADQITQILALWQQVNSDPQTVPALVEVLYAHDDHEWMRLRATISYWMKHNQPQYDFFQMLMDRHNEAIKLGEIIPKNWHTAD